MNIYLNEFQSCYLLQLTNLTSLTLEFCLEEGFDIFSKFPDNQFPGAVSIKKTGPEKWLSEATAYLKEYYYLARNDANLDIDVAKEAIKDGVSPKEWVEAYAEKYDLAKKGFYKKGGKTKKKRGSSKKLRDQARLMTSALNQSGLSKKVSKKMFGGVIMVDAPDAMSIAHDQLAT